MLGQMTEEQRQLAQEAKAKKRANGLAEYKQSCNMAFYLGALEAVCLQ